MLIFIAVTVISGLYGAYCAARGAVGFGCDLREDLFKKIQTFSFADIDKFSTGSLITRLINDITQVQNFIQRAMRGIMRSPGMLIGAVVMAFSINKNFWKHQQGSKRRLRNSISHYGIMIVQMPLMTLLLNFETLALVWFGGIGVMAGTVPIGDITAGHL